jgi:predicted TIM-barrel fold metal-dependent hydrolase
MGMPEMTEFLDLVQGSAGVRLDTTMAFTDFMDHTIDPEVIARLTDVQDRILFGSDFPNIPYEYAHQVEALARLDLGDDWLRDVLWNNAADLFGVAA